MAPQAALSEPVIEEKARENSANPDTAIQK
jgi:hypothetical protein